MTARILYDSTDLSLIPADAGLVGSYANGTYATQWADVKAMFPTAAHIRIDVLAEGVGNCLDVETGDATPDHARAWLEGRIAAGVPYPAIYCSRSTLAAVEAACAGLQYWHWVATLDGNIHIDGYKPLHRPAAIQFAGAKLAGVNVDVSIVYADGWHPTPLPAPPSPERYGFVAYPSQLGPGMTGRAVTSTDDGATWR
jgi:hypothetical protein